MDGILLGGISGKQLDVEALLVDDYNRLLHFYLDVKVPSRIRIWTVAASFI